MVLNKSGPVINTTEKKITFKNGVINLPKDKRKEIRKLMTFEKVPNQKILVQRAKNIVSLIEDGLEALNKGEEKVSEDDPMNYIWAIVISDCPDFFQRRLEDVLMVALFEPVYILPSGKLLWLYDNEEEWNHRRNALLPDEALSKIDIFETPEEDIPSYPTL